MKTCRGCTIMKPLGAFYRHKMISDGHLNFCKECVKGRVHRHRAENLERIQEYDRQRGQLPHRKAANKARAHLYIENHKIAVRRCRLLSPEREAARNAVNNAVRDGKLTPKPCERCGFAMGVQAHHEDYSKPLDVVWLCTKCHGQRHREINAERRATRNVA